MRGGWRWNSGRKGTNRKVEDLHYLDIRFLARRRLLAPGKAFSLQWRGQTGEHKGSVSAELEAPDLLRVRHRWRMGENGVWHTSSSSIRLVRTPSQFGGEHKWFVCADCGERAAILYLSDNRWLCRRSLKLAYRCQSENWWERMARRRDKAGNLVTQGERPKGMHRSTYHRLVKRWRGIEMAYDVLVDRELRKRRIMAGLEI